MNILPQQPPFTITFEMLVFFFPEQFRFLGLFKVSTKSEWVHLRYVQREIER